MRVLLIDADRDGREAVRAMLAGTGCGLVAAEGEEDGLSLFRALGAALVLCDLSTTGPDGVDLPRVLRRTHPGVKVLLLCWGGHADGMNLLPAGRDAGVDGLLLKPFRRAELLDAIERAGLVLPSAPR